MDGATYRQAHWSLALFAKESVSSHLKLWLSGARALWPGSALGVRSAGCERRALGCSAASPQALPSAHLLWRMLLAHLPEVITCSKKTQTQPSRLLIKESNLWVHVVSVNFCRDSLAVRAGKKALGCSLCVYLQYIYIYVYVHTLKVALLTDETGDSVLKQVGYRIPPMDRLFPWILLQQ